MNGKIRAVLVAIRRDFRATRRNLNGIDVPRTAAERPRDSSAAAADFEHAIRLFERQPRDDVLLSSQKKRHSFFTSGTAARRLRAVPPARR